jgi:signal transduction histidine kinase
MANPIKPFTFAAWMAWTTSQLFVAVYGQIGWTLSITAVAIGLIILSLAKLGWNHLPKSWGLTVRSVLLTLTFASISLLMFLSNHLIFGIDVRSTPVVAASALHLIVFGWVIALVTSIGSTLRGITSELELSTLELRREVVMLNATYRQMTSAIARILHGPVQDAVSVGLQKVSNANATEKNAKQIAGEVAESIRQSLLLMSAPSSSSRNLERSLSDLVELWEGIVNLTINMDSDIALAAALDNRVTDTIIEIVREATSNAVRHSEANHVKVRISRDYSMRAVLIVVTNDGATLDKHAPPGLGTRHLDELTLSWSRHHVGTEVALRALVPLAV